MMFLVVLTGSLGTTGGTSLNDWNKFVPKPFASPPAFDAWNELQLPHEWPLAFFEMSFLLPHFLAEGRGTIDVYFTRVYNPAWTNPDGFMWIDALRNEDQIKCHVALTPTWNESAWFADYVLPMGHAGERHDLMSQETHAGRWIGFRQPVRRVALEQAGKPVKYTYEANPGEVWEESEFWVELSWRMDPDGALGIRKYFESPADPTRPITQDEYWSHIFEHSVPGLPAAAAAQGLTPLAYMRKYGCFEISSGATQPYEQPVDAAGASDLRHQLAELRRLLVGHPHRLRASGAVQELVRRRFLRGHHVHPVAPFGDGAHDAREHRPMMAERPARRQRAVQAPSMGIAAPDMDAAASEQR